MPRQMDLCQIRSWEICFQSYRKKQERKSVETERSPFLLAHHLQSVAAATLWKGETTTQACSLIIHFHPPACEQCLIFTLFCSLQWLRSLSSSWRAAEAHCAASLRMRLFMKLSDSFPVPTCSSRAPMSDWKTAWVTGEVKIINGKCGEVLHVASLLASVSCLCVTLVQRLCTWKC